MNSKLLSEKALTVVDQYAHFHIHGATTSVPYYNNNHKKIRAALRATTGKGSPRDIFDETEITLVKEGSFGAIKGGAFRPDLLTNENLRHFLVDQDLGIDCSGFVYHVLNAESTANRNGSLDRHLHFPLCKGIIGKIRCTMRPVENASVATFAHEKNSHVIALSDVQPGDFITMLGVANLTLSAATRDHIVIITHVEYQNFVPTVLHYVHSIAWPSDGEYGHGVRSGTISIIDINKPLLEQIWEEAGKTGLENYTRERATAATTELRRLNWFK
ncbi:MAG: hypothetical protein WCQ60_02735 [bacterium]